MEKQGRISFNDVLLENIDTEKPIRNFLRNPTLTHNHGTPNDVTMETNHNVSHIEKIEKYNDAVLEPLKQNIKDMLKQYPPTINVIPICTVISSVKDHFLTGEE